MRLSFSSALTHGTSLTARREVINVAFVGAAPGDRDMSERREEHELSKRRRKLDLAGANRTDEMEPPPRRPRPSGVGPSRTLGIVLLTLGITGAAVILGGLCCAGLVPLRTGAPGVFGPQPGFPRHGFPRLCRRFFARADCGPWPLRLRRAPC